MGMRAILHLPCLPHVHAGGGIIGGRGHGRLREKLDADCKKLCLRHLLLLHQTYAR